MLTVNNLTEHEMEALKDAVRLRGNCELIELQEIEKLKKEYGLTFPKSLYSKNNQVADGVYKLPLEGTSWDPKEFGELEGVEWTTYLSLEDLKVDLGDVPTLDFSGMAVKEQDSSLTIDETKGYIPSINPSFVPDDNFERIKKVIESGLHMPIWLSGPTGTGKTEAVRQACALLGRELYTIHTFNSALASDFIGGSELKDGETQFVLGAAPLAALRGGVLLIDEIDQAETDIMILQALLNREPFHIKRTNRVIHPAPGFMVIATGNTKGMGDMTGLYQGAKTMNFAFLNRFSMILEYDYPGINRIEAILTANVKNNVDMGEYVKPEDLKLSEKDKNEDSIQMIIGDLAQWARHVHDNVESGTVDHDMSIRDLITILKLYSVFGEMTEAIKLNVSRFDPRLRESYIDMWRLISGRTWEDHKRLITPKKVTNKKKSKDEGLSEKSDLRYSITRDASGNMVYSTDSGSTVVLGSF